MSLIHFYKCLHYVDSRNWIPHNLPITNVKWYYVRITSHPHKVVMFWEHGYIKAGIAGLELHISHASYSQHVSLPTFSCLCFHRCHRRWRKVHIKWGYGSGAWGWSNLPRCKHTRGSCKLTSPSYCLASRGVQRTDQETKADQWPVPEEALWSWCLQLQTPCREKNRGCWWQQYVQHHKSGWGGTTGYYPGLLHVRTEHGKLSYDGNWTLVSTRVCHGASRCSGERLQEGSHQKIQVSLWMFLLPLRSSRWLKKYQTSERLVWQCGLLDIVNLWNCILDAVWSSIFKKTCDCC